MRGRIDLKGMRNGRSRFRQGLRNRRRLLLRPLRGPCQIDQPAAARVYMYILF
jgi:hypothetical protein